MDDMDDMDNVYYVLCIIYIAYFVYAMNAAVELCCAATAAGCDDAPSVRMAVVVLKRTSDRLDAVLAVAVLLLGLAALGLSLSAPR